MTPFLSVPPCLRGERSAARSGINYEFPMLRPAGPKPHFLIGNMPLARRDPLAVFSKWSAEFGDIFYYRAAWIQVYFLNHPDLIEAVLVRNYQNFLKDHVIRKSRWFFGEGLLTNEGESWLRQRRLSQPAFHRDRIASYARIMTGYASQMLDSWKQDETLDIHQEMMQLTLRIVVRALFNVEAEQIGAISTALNVMMRNSTGIRLLLPPAARYLPTPAMIQFRRAVRRLDETVYGIIAARRRNEIDSGDLLSMLMQARDEDGGRMTDKQLRDEVMTFLLAGHETTANALTWTWYLLSSAPEIEARVHEEVDRVLNGRLPTVADIGALPLVEQVVTESMRLYPPAWIIGRRALQDYRIGEYLAPARSILVMSPYVLQRDARYFPDPERFNPDRWTPTFRAALPPFAYFPFGGGPRRCIGESFAWMELVLVVATVAQQWQLRLVPGHPVAPQPVVTLRTKHGMKMTVHRRLGRCAIE